MADLRLTIGNRNYACDVPVKNVCVGLYVCYQVLLRDKTAEDLEGMQDYEKVRQLYNTAQVLFNFCNVGAITTFVLVCLRSLPLSLTTVALTASFWVARELVLQDVLEFEKREVLECVIEGHKKVNPDWKANIEMIGMVWSRRILPPVSKENIGAGKLIVAALKEKGKEIGRELLEEGKDQVKELIEQGQEAVQGAFYPLLNQDEKK